jgi:3-dehydroquinate dehydratase-2
MTPVRNRVAVLHGVNLDMLGRRDPAHYGTLTLAELEELVGGFARDLELEVDFFQTNSERAFVERLHELPARADGILINPGAWTHYSWAIHDALEIAGLPTVEVHLSQVDERESWRRVSVVRDLAVACVSGRGLEGYREALVRLSKELEG